MGQIKLYWYKWWGGNVVVGREEGEMLYEPRFFHITQKQFVLGMMPGNPQSISTTGGEYMYPASEDVLDLYNESTSSIIQPTTNLVS